MLHREEQRSGSGRHTDIHLARLALSFFLNISIFTSLYKYKLLQSGERKKKTERER